MLDQEKRDLIERASNGDEKAFEQLCEWKAKDILYIALRLMDNVKDAEDAAQEVLAYMYRNMNKLRSPEAFNVWLYRIVRGVCANMRRKNKKETEPMDEVKVLSEQSTEFLPQALLEDAERRELVMGIIDTLPERSKLCILLFYFENMSYMEIASTLGIKKKDVDHALSYGKTVVRKKLENKKNMKKYLSQLFSAAPVPAIARIMMGDAKQAVTSQSVQNVTTGWKDIVDGNAPSVLEGVDLGDMTVEVTTDAGGLTKALLGIAIAAGIGAGIYGFLSTPEKAPDVDQSMTEMSAEEKEIRTLADMIGTDEERHLLAYVEEVGDIHEAEQFLETIELSASENVWKAVAGIEDTLYVHTKQRKKLMVIVRHDTNADSYQMAYKFTDIEDTQPEDVGIFMCFEEWKQTEDTYVEGAR